MFQNNAFKIETERLIIRCYKIEDAVLLKNLVDSSVDHLRPFMPWAADEPQPLQAKIDLLRNWIGQFFKNEDFIYGAFLKSGELIGSTGLHTRRGKGILEIGYWIGKDYNKKGYATELSYALTKVAIQHIGVEKVEIRNDILNYASERIPQKLNFQNGGVITQLGKRENGTRIQHVIWNLFVEDFVENIKYEPIVMFDALDNQII
ncbi:MAG: GNAT family N-acetyltransferase [Chitinophagales bacterium]